MHEDREVGTDAGLRRLGELGDYEVADGDPDVRGWTVTSRDGQRLGRVEELLVDTRAMRVRYLEVAAEGSGERMRIAVDPTRLDRASRTIIAEGGTLEGISAVGSMGAADATAGGEARVTRSEEELSIGKRRVQAGTFGIRKRVETEHVAQPVTRMREEVEVERRPVAGDRAAGRAGAEIRADEVRIPIVEEEIVVEKRPVVKEEIVVRTSEVTEERVVEADLRRERVDIDDTTRHGTTRDLNRDAELRDR